MTPLLYGTSVRPERYVASTIRVSPPYKKGGNECSRFCRTIRFLLGSPVPQSICALIIWLRNVRHKHRKTIILRFFVSNQQYTSMALHFFCVVSGDESTALLFTKYFPLHCLDNSGR